MTVGEAMFEAWMHFFLRSNNELAAKHWHKLPKEVRETLANATSEEISKVVAYSPGW